MPEVPPSYHPAGEALVEQARREAMLGNPAAAGSTLERALRIDGANPWIWIELGYLRLEAGQDDAAESMARKALSLATADAGARAAAERLLGEAGRAR
jgi:Flp pilus assembly protein TadD